MNYDEIKQNMIHYIVLILNDYRWTFKHLKSNFNEFAEIYNLSIYMLASFEDHLYFKLDTVSGDSLAYYLKSRSTPVNLNYYIKQWIHITIHFYYKYYREDFSTKRDKALYDIHKTKGYIL